MIQALAASPTDRTLALAGTLDGNVWRGHRLGTGGEREAIWTDLTGGHAVVPDRPVLDLAFDPTDPAVAYAAYGGYAANTPGRPGHVYRLACADAAPHCADFTWTDVSGDLPDVPINALAVNPHRPAQLFAGGDWGLYVTDDAGAEPVQWRRVTAGLPTAMVFDLDVDYGATVLGVFTRSRGAWVRPLAGAEIFADGFETGDLAGWSRTEP